MYRPTLDEVKAMAGRGNLVPIYREIEADLETPVSAYLKVARSPYSFLLESVEGGEEAGPLQFHRHGSLQDSQDGQRHGRGRRGPPYSHQGGDGQA